MKKKILLVTGIAVTVMVLAVLIIAGVTWMLSEQEAAATAQKAISDARLAMNDGEYRRSLECVAEALAIDPGLTEPRLLRAQLPGNPDYRSG